MNRRSRRERPSDEHIAKTQDMNGIIHPCCHPEAGPQPESEPAPHPEPEPEPEPEVDPCEVQLVVDFLAAALGCGGDLLELDPRVVPCMQLDARRREEGCGPDPLLAAASPSPPPPPPLMPPVPPVNTTIAVSISSAAADGCTASSDGISTVSRAFAVYTGSRPRSARPLRS